MTRPVEWLALARIETIETVAAGRERESGIEREATSAHLSPAQHREQQHQCDQCDRHLSQPARRVVVRTPMGNLGNLTRLTVVFVIIHRVVYVLLGNR